MIYKRIILLMVCVAFVIMTGCCKKATSVQDDGCLTKVNEFAGSFIMESGTTIAIYEPPPIYYLKFVDSEGKAYYVQVNREEDYYTIPKGEEVIATIQVHDDPVFATEKDFEMFTNGVEKTLRDIQEKLRLLRYGD